MKKGKSRNKRKKTRSRLLWIAIAVIGIVYISEELTIPHGQSDHLSRRFRSLISERDSR